MFVSCDDASETPTGDAVTTLPEGHYLCGYHRGPWSSIPALYQSMLEIADKQELKLGNHAYERGLNEFAIAGPEEYVTRILIPIRD